MSIKVKSHGNGPGGNSFCHIIAETHIVKLNMICFIPKKVLMKSLLFLFDWLKLSAVIHLDNVT